MAFDFCQLDDFISKIIETTLTIIGKIITQIKKAIKKLTLEYSNLEISIKIFGNMFPPIVPIMIDNNTQIDKYFSNLPLIFQIKFLIGSYPISTLSSIIL